MMGNVSKLEKKKVVPLGNCVGKPRETIYKRFSDTHPVYGEFEVFPFQILLKLSEKLSVEVLFFFHVLLGFTFY